MFSSTVEQERTTVSVECTCDLREWGEMLSELRSYRAGHEMLMMRYGNSKMVTYSFFEPIAALSWHRLDDVAAWWLFETSAILQREGKSLAIPTLDSVITVYQSLVQRQCLVVLGVQTAEEILSLLVEFLEGTGFERNLSGAIASPSWWVSHGARTIVESAERSGMTSVGDLVTIHCSCCNCGFEICCVLGVVVWVGFWSWNSSHVFRLDL